MLRYFGIIAGMLLVILLAAGSTYLAWPWIMSEHMRLTRLELVLTLLAEAGALIWFVYFLIKFMVTSETDSAFDEDIAHSPGMQFLAGVVILAAAIDLGATFFFQAQSNARRKTATQSVCRITKVKEYYLKPLLDKEGAVVGDLFCALVWCDVITEDGKKHSTFYYGKENRVPKSVHEAVGYGRLQPDLVVEKVAPIGVEHVVEALERSREGQGPRNVRARPARAAD